MAVFVLVHGAWHGGWCWSRVRNLLQRQGHEVHTPTLTGVGERSHLLSRDIGLATHVADVANLLRWEGLNDAILCGHSYGGSVISGAAHREPGRISTLVYLDAFVLEHGQSIYGTLSPESRAANIERTRQLGDGWKVPPISAAHFNVNEADREWVDRQCTPQSEATFTDGLELPHGLPAHTAKRYIYASGYGNSPFHRYRDIAVERGWAVTDIESGHDVMLDQPAQLAEVLAAAV